MTKKVFPPVKDGFGKVIRGPLVYRTRQFHSRRLLWTGKILPAAYFLVPRY